MPRRRVAQIARAEGLRDEFEGLQQLRQGAGLRDQRQLASLPNSLKVGILHIDRDTPESLQTGLQRLIELINGCPSHDSELLKLSFNIDGSYGECTWMNRSDDFANTHSWCYSGRTVRYQADLAILRMLRRELGASASILAVQVDTPDEERQASHRRRVDSAAPSQQRRQTLEIDAAYQEWARNRGDVERLRRLHAAISEALGGLVDTTQR